MISTPSTVRPEKQHGRGLDHWQNALATGLGNDNKAWSVEATNFRSIMEGDQAFMILYPRARASALTLTFKDGMLAGIALVSAFILMCQFVMWYVAAVLLIAWLPFCVQYTLTLVKHDARLAIYFVFLAMQSVHMTEHVAQMVQIHVMNRVFANSHGLFGAWLDVEFMHFFFDSLWIPFCTAWLLMLYGQDDVWLWALLPLALWHGAEHVVIMDAYIRTGIAGSPGILASGGLIGGPLSRPDLHFIYNLVEEYMILAGFRHQTGGR